ncbi:MAG: YeiH family putative sulfate export transporter [Firmicutes bacterium]|nr:YeiH family putative sulfate export transporter [Bacillota bacterium]
MDFIKTKGPGILIAAFVACVSTFLSGLNFGSFSFEIIGAPVFAILIGMIITAILPNFASSDTMKTGVTFTSKKILQYAVIILGFSLNIKTVLSVGGQSLPVIISTIATSLVIAFVLCKMLKMDKNVSVLIGVGSSICGGSAVAATAPVIDATDEEIARSISVIFLFNVIAALIFPTLGNIIGLSNEGFALFAGTAINDTSSVTAAASAWDSMKGTNGMVLAQATTVKLTRTLAIIPITLVLALYRTNQAKKVGGEAKKVAFGKIFPWFILYFIGASLITTVMSLLPESGITVLYADYFVGFAKKLAKFFIAMAMCAIGLNTNVVNLIKKGGQPIIMGFCCWVAIACVSLLMQHLLGYW